MSSISSISSGANPYQAAGQRSASQTGKDFQAIGSALQSRNLSTAQTALASFQQDLQASSQATASQPFGKNSQANTDFQSLTSALKSGNLSNAQQAYATLQSDLKGAQSAHKGHHPHYGSGSTVVTAASSTAAATSAVKSTGGSGMNVTA